MLELLSGGFVSYHNFLNFDFPLLNSLYFTAAEFYL